MSKLCVDENKKILGSMSCCYLKYWSSIPSEDLSLMPDVIRECGDRAARFCSALAMMLNLDGGTVQDVQYFRKYRGSELFEKMVKNAFNQESSFWQEQFDDIVRTAASSRLAAPKLQRIEDLLDNDAATVEDICGGVVELFELKPGLRKGTTARLENKLHAHIVQVAKGVIHGEATAIRSKMVDQLLGVLTGNLASFPGSIKVADALRDWMTSKSHEIEEIELMELILEPMLSRSCASLQDLDTAKLGGFVKTLAGTQLSKRCLEMLDKFYFKTLSILHREALL